MFTIVGLVQNKEEKEEIISILKHALTGFRAMELSQGVQNE